MNRVTSYNFYRSTHLPPYPISTSPRKKQSRLHSSRIYLLGSVMNFLNHNATEPNLEVRFQVSNHQISFHAIQIMCVKWPFFAKRKSLSQDFNKAEYKEPTNYLIFNSPIYCL